MDCEAVREHFPDKVTVDPQEDKVGRGIQNRSNSL